MCKSPKDGEIDLDKLKEYDDGPVDEDLLKAFLEVKPGDKKPDKDKPE